MVAAQKATKCVAEKKDDGTVTGFKWDMKLDKFKCVNAMDLILGGISEERTYLNDVELYGPGQLCHGERMPPFPIKVIGAIGAYAGQGAVIVCGGAEDK